MAAFAKTSSPRPTGALRRERLFRLLDQRANPVTWVCAPAGAGKTTLVASYLEAHRVPALWYRVDPGDTDPAAIFYYLSQALPATRRRRPPLPLLAPEDAHDLAGFARRFFRSFFERLAPGSVLVFDDCERVPADLPFHQVLGHALAEIPVGMRVIAISREAPPTELSRPLVSQTVSVIPWEALRLTLDETRSLAELQTGADERAVCMLHAHSEGWVAGVLLMLKHSMRDSANRVQIDGHDALLDYFQSELFGGFDSATRTLLLSTALLPRFTAAMAEKISGVSSAHKLLTSLCRKHCFTSCSGGPDAVYQYHALFQEFLEVRVRESFSAAERAQLLHRGAILLEGVGQLDDAHALYRKAGDWSGVVRMILKVAPTLFEQGRWKTLASWIVDVPQDARVSEPWLLYWLGVCQGPADPSAARETFELAFAEFSRRDDALGRSMAVSGVIEIYVARWADLQPVERWIVVLEQVLAAEGPVFSSADIELRVRASLAIAALYCRPQNTALRESIDRITQLLPRAKDLNQKAFTGVVLFAYGFWTGDREPAENAMEQLNSLLFDERVSARNRIWLRVGYAHHLVLQAAHGEAAGFLEQAQKLCKDEGLRFVEPALFVYRAWIGLSTGVSKAVESLVEAGRPILNSPRRLIVSTYHSELAWLAMERGDWAVAIEHERAALTCAVEGHASNLQAWCLSKLAEACIEGGLYEEARQHLAAIDTRSIGTHSVIHFHSFLMYAYLLLMQGQNCTDALRQALAIGRQGRLMDTFRWRPTVMARLCASALASNIESAYVRSLIKVRGLVPESTEVEEWPWPIKIYTLGRFQLVLDDAPRQAGGKAQQVPLELLKALIAFGGRGVDGAKLENSLWPQAEGDAARKALDTTLHRLRKLLGADQAVAVKEGKLTLDSRYCWIDVWALERRLSRIDQALASGAEQELQRLTQDIFALYQGHFLAEAPGRAWMLSLRDRLRSKFVRHIKALGRHWEEAGCPDRAIRLYEKGLEIDNLAEELYRRLMKLHQSQGRHVEALATYRRCRQSLSVILGISPSADTQAIFHSLSS
jgi:ATP/maltotriose-dependent transcriptional regulator MalT/DNA-binding SARP family transcriptional activator